MNCSKKGYKLNSEEKIDRRIMKSKKNVNLALLNLMKEQKIRDITITELCKTAHVNRKTFYTYYHSVRDVLLEHEDTIAKEITKGIFDLDDKKADASLIVLTYQQKFRENEEFLTYLYEQELIYTFEDKLKVRFFNAAFERFEMYHVPTERLKKASLALNYIVAGIVSMQLNWFFSKSAVSFDTLVQISHDFIKANVSIIRDN